MDADTDRRLLDELNTLGLRPLAPKMKKSTLYEHFKRMEEVEARPRAADAPPPKDPNKVITKEEAKRLRESVLRANRPLNPWFSASDVRAAEARTAAQSTPPPATTISTVPRRSPPPAFAQSLREDSRERRIPIKIEKPRLDHHYEEPFSQSLRDVISTPRKLSEQPRKLGESVPRRQPDIIRRNVTQAIDFTLPELTILENESRERTARVERQRLNNNDGRSSASTYYFSDDGSDNMRVDKFDDIFVTKSRIPRCDMCFALVNDVILQALGKNFHPQCFRCLHCNRCLDGLPFAVDGTDRVYCVEDYEKLFVPLCARCHEPIKQPDSTGQVVRVQAMSKEFHVSCYACEGCGRQLTNEYHRRCYPIDEHLLCMDCNQRWRTNGGPLTDV